MEVAALLFAAIAAGTTLLLNWEEVQTRIIALREPVATFLRGPGLSLLAVGFVGAVSVAGLGIALEFVIRGIADWFGAGPR